MHWTTADEQKEQGVRIFHTTYTFLVDGSEQKVDSSNNPIIDSEFYSVKKKHHTINIVAFVSLRGFIYHLSKSYPGNTNDAQIIKDTASNWMTYLNERDNGIGDLGFEALREKNIPIDTPPSNHNLDSYKLLSQYRIKVENVFSQFKDWKACKEILHIQGSQKKALLTFHNQVWKTVAMLININLLE